MKTSTHTPTWTAQTEIYSAALPCNNKNSILSYCCRRSTAACAPTRNQHNNVTYISTIDVLYNTTTHHHYILHHQVGVYVWCYCKNKPVRWRRKRASFFAFREWISSSGTTARRNWAGGLLLSAKALGARSTEFGSWRLRLLLSTKMLTNSCKIPNSGLKIKTKDRNM